MKGLHLLIPLTICSLLISCFRGESEVNTNNSPIPSPTPRASVINRSSSNESPREDSSNKNAIAVPASPPPTPPPARQPDIEWGVLTNYFTISNARIERQLRPNPLGKAEEFNVLAFTVEAKTTMRVAIFFAHFYDAEDIEVAQLSPVRFNPDYSTYQWQPGNRSRATVILPDNMSNLRTIRFKQL